MTDGCFTQGARLEFVVKPFLGRVTFQVWAEYEAQDGSEARLAVLDASFSPMEAERLARCVRELADGNVGGFDEAGLEFEAEEYGYTIVTPSRRGVWFEGEENLRGLADRLEKAAREGAE